MIRLFIIGFNVFLNYTNLLLTTFLKDFVSFYLSAK
jgi:hypothetical protein